jgi:hypothetical protein
MSDKLYITINGKKREMNAEEKTQFEKDIEAQRLIEAEQTKKDADRESAMAKLKKLGLTDDEIAALVP